MMFFSSTSSLAAKSSPVKNKNPKDKESSIISSRYRVIVQKDPFDKERGGSETGENGAPEAPAEGISENYELYGIIRTGNLRKAFLKEKRGKSTRIKWNRKKKRVNRPKFRIVVEGDLVDGWTVKEIASSGIVLSAGGRTVRMEVFSSGKSNRKALKPVAIQTKRDIPPAVPSPVTPVPAGSKKPGKPKTSPKIPELAKPAGNVKGKATAAHPEPSTPKPRRNPFKRVLKGSTSTGIKTPPPMTPDDEAILSPEDITVPPLNLPGK